MDKPENEQKERRDYFRINDQIYLNYEIVSEEEYKNARQLLENDHTSPFSLSANFTTLNYENNQILHTIKRNTPEIAQYLDFLNRKIDDLSRYLLESAMPLSNSKLVTANISASGIAFNTHEKLVQGQTIKIQLVLMPEKVGIQAYGRIIDSAPVSNSTDYYTSLDLEHILDDDRELMIKHNLNKQMLELRQKSQEKE